MDGWMMSLQILTQHVTVLCYYDRFLTFLLLVGFQKATDKQVNSADCVICPLAQRSDKMFQVLSQVGM